MTRGKRASGLGQHECQSHFDFQESHQLGEIAVMGSEMCSPMANRVGCLEPGQALWLFGLLCSGRRQTRHSVKRCLFGLIFKYFFRHVMCS